MIVAEKSNPKSRLQGTKTLKVANLLNEFEKDDVKKSVDIVDLFSYFGVTLTKKGRNFMGLCPWHDDENPSLSVDRDQGLYNCFGCGESGDIFSLAEKMRGYTFREAVVFLKSWNPSTGLRDQGPDDIIQSTESIRPLLPDGDTQSHEPGAGTAESPPPPPMSGDSSPASGISLDDVASYYHDRLLMSEKAQDYLASRGIDMILAVRFRIGFCDGTITEKTGKDQKTALTEYGILNDKGREHFTNCITFPITDESGSVVSFYGRSISDASTKLSNRAKVSHLYLKGPHRGVFNRKASTIYDEIILTESIIDALSLITFGIENVQALYGTNGLTDEHLQALRDDRVKTVILALDNDDAGRTASGKLKERLLSDGFTVKVIVPPSVSSMFPDRPESEVKDWNEYLTRGGSKESLKQCIAAADVCTVSEHIPYETDRRFTCEKDHTGYIFTTDEVVYRVSGVKEMFMTSLRVNIKASLTSNEEIKYYDNLDLYSARSRGTYSQNLSREFDLEQKRIEKDLISILEYCERERDRKLMVGSGQNEREELTAEDRELGMTFLSNPDLFDELVEDMEILGYVGEELNKQLMYLAATSRKLDDPISVMVISESSAGKSFLIDTVARLIPPDEVISVTSLSEQALNYMDDLSHKFVSLGEIVHSDVVEHQIREMLSRKELSRLVTTKEPQTGKLVTRMVSIPSVVSLALSGTRYDINPENTSRCFMVNVDESREQTKRIQKIQRIKKYSLTRNREKSDLVPEIIRKHHAAQRLLEPVVLNNTLGRYLDFPDRLMRTRRDNDRFIDLIASVCYLRQYQKERENEGGVEYIEFDLADYEIAYRIMVEGVLSSSLLELPRGAVVLYEAVRKLAQKEARKKGIEVHEVTLTQREIREHTGFGHTWLKTHLRHLCDYEYVLLIRGGAARSKGHYRLRADEDIESINISMIPTPAEMKQYIEGKN